MARKSQKNVGKTTKKQTMNFNAKNCDVCGRSFTPKSGCQKYCEVCKLHVIRQQKADYARRYNERVKMKLMEAEKKPRFSARTEILALTELHRNLYNDFVKLNRNLLIVAIIASVALLASIVAIVL